MIKSEPDLIYVYKQSECLKFNLLDQFERLKSVELLYLVIYQQLIFSLIQF